VLQLDMEEGRMLDILQQLDDGGSAISVAFEMGKAAGRFEISSGQKKELADVGRLIDVVCRGQKIQAIKAVRMLTGANLRAAKEEVDKYHLPKIK